jgi:hypothetical protein
MTHFLRGSLNAPKPSNTPTPEIFENESSISNLDNTSPKILVKIPPESCNKSIKWLAWKEGMTETCAQVDNWRQIEAFKTGNLTEQQALEAISATKLPPIKNLRGLGDLNKNEPEEHIASANKQSAKLNDRIDYRKKLTEEGSISSEEISYFKNDFQIRAYLLNHDLEESLKINTPLKLAALKSNMKAEYVEKITLWHQVAAFICCHEAEESLTINTSDSLLNYSCPNQESLCYTNLGEAQKIIGTILSSE